MSYKYNSHKLRLASLHILVPRRGNIIFPNSLRQIGRDFLSSYYKNITWIRVFHLLQNKWIFNLGSIPALLLVN